MEGKLKVGIVGLGLIGASIAAALYPHYTIVGVDNNKESEQFCLVHGIVDEIFDRKKLSDDNIVGKAFDGSKLSNCDIEDRILDRIELDDDNKNSFEVLRGCFVIFVCTPVWCISQTIQDVFDVVGGETLITDVASVKTSIIDLLPKGIRFVGGHPMSGREKGGTREYSPSLFDGKTYVLTDISKNCIRNDASKNRIKKDSDCILVSEDCSEKRVGNTFESDLEMLKRLITKYLRANVLVTTQVEHDVIVSKISGLPHVLAYTLSCVALESDNARSFAAGSIKDMTRVALSDPEFWTTVVHANAENLVKDIVHTQEVLEQIRLDIEDGKSCKIRKIFTQGQHLRKELETGNTFIMPLYVDVKDEIGSLAVVTAILSKASVNISGIRVLNRREGFDGAISLDFLSETEREAAKEVLRGSGYLAD